MAFKSIAVAALLSAAQSKYYVKHNWAPFSVKELADLSNPVADTPTQDPHTMMQTEEDNIPIDDKPAFVVPVSAHALMTADDFEEDNEDERLIKFHLAQASIVK